MEDEVGDFAEVGTGRAATAAVVERTQKQSPL